MWVYLSLPLLAPAGAAAAHRLNPRGRAAVYGLVGVFLIVAIGFRFHVGCDWNPYLLLFVRSQGASLAEALTMNSPGYMLVNWLAAQAGLSIAAVNTFCAIVLVSGLLAFCSDQSKPWLALLICIPVLILLAGFSATRQATALGFLLWALHLHLTQRGTAAILASLMVGATFHATLLLMVPLVLLMRRDVPARANLILMLAGLVGLGGAVFGSLVPPFSTLIALYPSSAGAWFRAVPTLLALIAYAVVRRRVEMPARESSMLFWLAAFSLFYLPLGLASTTIMDRLGWFAIPFQAAALARLAGLARSPVEGVALGSAVSAPFVLLVLGWLNLGAMTSCLIPYQSYLTRPRLLLGDDSARTYKYNDATDPWETIYPPAGKRAIEDSDKVVHPGPDS